MPEILTKYPDIVIELLQNLGVVCGEGDPQILKQCPIENFCDLPKGELCVLGLDKSDELTQFSVTSIQEGGENNLINILVILMILVLLFALVYLVIYWLKRRRKKNKKREE